MLAVLTSLYLFLLPKNGKNKKQKVERLFKAY